MIQLFQGNCFNIMQQFKANVIDSIVTDPPYGLAFMNQKWDYSIPSVSTFLEMYRILKPGSFLLCFGGSRTYHRMACNIEDAGFELRDCIMWVYGEGFPKGHDISKSLDQYQDSLPVSDLAKQFDGYNTALKPAYEPIIVAMKPLDKNYANNATIWGLSGLNIDACRIKTSEALGRPSASETQTHFKGLASGFHDRSDQKGGRWPANFIHDGSKEVLDLFPETSSGKLKEEHKKGCGGVTTFQNTLNNHKITGNYGGDNGSASRFFYCAKATKEEREEGLDWFDYKVVNDGRKTSIDNPYQRGITLRKNIHPTVKPVALMKYLCTLTRPPSGGIVLDPFMGSGTTGIGAIKSDRSFIGCELSENYFQISEKRIKWIEEQIEKNVEFVGKNYEQRRLF